MSTIRAVAAHEVVRAAFPRPVVEGQEVALAAGKALDAMLSRLSHGHAQGHRVGVGSLTELAAEVFDDELAAAGAEPSPTEREKLLAIVPSMIRAFRGSVLLGLPRPRSRLILINSRAGVYAQPDFWNGRDAIYEMKSYNAIPPRPDVLLQLRLFQLAFPGFRQSLVCIDRHATPVTTRAAEIPPPSAEEQEDVLRLAERVALELGVDKVFEYVPPPVVRYDVSPKPPPTPAVGAGRTDGNPEEGR